MYRFVVSQFVTWRHQMEKCSVLLALCAATSPVTGEFPSKRPVTQSFDVLVNLHLNKRLSKQSDGRWFETPSRSLWRHCNGLFIPDLYKSRIYDGQMRQLDESTLYYKTYVPKIHQPTVVRFTGIKNHTWFRGYFDAKQTNPHLNKMLPNGLWHYTNNGGAQGLNHVFINESMG